MALLAGALLATLAALPFVLCFAGAVVAMHYSLPAVTVLGYACDWQGNVLCYRLNGGLVLAVTLAVWIILPLNVQAYAATHFWACLSAANLLGLLLAGLLAAGSSHEPACRCITADQLALRERAAAGEDVCRTVARSPTRSAAGHFFFGRRFNPRLRGLDLKMLLYTFGACALAWNVMSAAALRQQQQLMAAERSEAGLATISRAQLVYTALLLWFVAEYMALEVVHLCKRKRL